MAGKLQKLNWQTYVNIYHDNSEQIINTCAANKQVMEKTSTVNNVHLHSEPNLASLII